MTTETVGLDFAWTKPAPQACWDAEYRFIIGYISHDTGKDLWNPRDYRKAGLGVHFVFEWTAERALGGTSAGRLDGAYTEQRLNYLDENLTSPVFFAVDFDIQKYQFPLVQAYANGFNLATRRPVGMYGSIRAINQFVTPGYQPVQYGWQTSAWSGDAISSKANIYQRHTHHYPPPGIPLFSFDENVLLKDLP